MSPSNKDCRTSASYFYRQRQFCCSIHTPHPQHFSVTFHGFSRFRFCRRARDQIFLSRFVRSHRIPVRVFVCLGLQLFALFPPLRQHRLFLLLVLFSSTPLMESLKGALLNDRNNRSGDNEGDENNDNNNNNNNNTQDVQMIEDIETARFGAMLEEVQRVTSVSCCDTSLLCLLNKGILRRTSTSVHYCVVFVLTNVLTFFLCCSFGARWTP